MTIICALVCTIAPTALTATPLEDKVQHLSSLVETLMKKNTVLEKKITELEATTVRCNFEVQMRSGFKDAWLVTLNEKTPVDWRAEAVPTEWLGKMPWNYERNWIIICK